MVLGLLPISPSYPGSLLLPCPTSRMDLGSARSILRPCSTGLQPGISLAGRQVAPGWRRLCRVTAPSRCGALGRQAAPPKAPRRSPHRRRVYPQ